MKRMTGRFGTLSAAIVLAFVAWPGCGYSLAGRGTFLPEYIQTIGIPLFRNSTSFFQVDQILTEKVRSEFIARGKYQVLPEATEADAVLAGTITSVALVPVSFTQQQQASRYQLQVTASFEFRDIRAKNILWQNPALLFVEEYEVATGSGALDPRAFFGQGNNAVDRVTTNFARTVVTAILEAF